MYIEILKPSGFCAGVNSAINACLSIKEKTEFAHYYTYGNIVHNDNVIEKLKGIGIIPVSPTLDSLKVLTQDDCLIFSAHGIDEKARDYLESKEIVYFDTVCPFVLRNKEFIESHGGDIIYIGKASHPEAKAIFSLDLNKKIVLFDSITPLDKDLKNVAIVSQTTMNKDIVDSIISEIVKVYPKAYIFPSICNVTKARQDQVAHLDVKFDALLVVGSASSSNTNELLSSAKNHGINAILVGSVSDLYSLDFSQYKAVAIITGASTDICDAYLIKEYLDNEYK